jgi:hypothetical protein
MAEPADIVICRHVIEHVADPMRLLREIRSLVNPGVRLFFETPCADWIIRNQVFWDLFYEHCSLFTMPSLFRAFTTAGFVVNRIRHVFGGQYLWLEAGLGGTQEISPLTTDLAHRALDFGRRRRELIDRWRSLLAPSKARSNVVVWGAGAKGTTFCNLTDPQAQLIRSVVDINPHKQGRFLAGTGHRIINPTQLRANTTDAVFVLNPNYLDEVRQTLDSLMLAVPVIDIMKYDTDVLSVA